tara:strand:- start:1590 stop:1988 length:399 start_codon:yes stop_codon:yes gene_type:complete
MAQTRFRGPVLQGKFNEAGVTGYNLEEKNADYTIATGDLGKLFTSKSGSPTFTTHAHGNGYTYSIVNTGADAANEIKITEPVGSKFSFAGGTHTTLTNTKATSKVGDFVTIHSGASGTMWYVLNVQGTWAGS